MTDPAQAEARYKAWSDIYAQIVEEAPWAPIFNEQRFTFRSKRMGGDDALYVDPVHIPVHYDAVTVNE
jgi:oligopeptide transport system substrate-binding protein